MSKNLLWLLVAAALVVPLGCSSEDDDDTPPPPAPWGPSGIAVGDNGLMMIGSLGGTWTQVTPATTTIAATADLVKVVKVPGHASGRMVAIANRNDTLDSNAEIWYNDGGGNGAWTKATFGTSDANLDAVHVAGSTYDDWDLTDIMFLNSTEGYAVGTNYIILYTNDAGATWTDLNDHQPAGDPTILYQLLTLTGNIPATFVPGATITGTGAPAPTGTIIAANEYWDELTVMLVGTTQFTNGMTITAPGAATVSTAANTPVWQYPTGTVNCMYGIQGTPGSGTRGVHTLWLGTANQTSIPSGVWKIVSNDPATAGARTFTFTGPDLGDQYTIGQVGYYDINSLYFFDTNTGCAATDDGVFYTNSTATPAGLTYTQFTASDNDIYFGFVYSAEPNSQSGFLYSISDNTVDNEPGRVAVTYTAGTPGTWSFGATPTWEVHATSANVSQYYVRYPNMFLNSGKIFVYSTNPWSSGHWGWCGNFTDATLNNTLWQDTYEQYMGGTMANGDNPAYQKEIFGTGSVPASGYVRCILPN